MGTQVTGLLAAGSTGDVPYRCGDLVGWVYGGTVVARPVACRRLLLCDVVFFDSLPRYVSQSNVGAGQELAAVQTLLDLAISAVTTFNPGTTTFRASTRQDPRNHSSHRAPGWFLPFQDNSQTSGAVSDCMEWAHVVAGRDGDN